MTGRGDSITLVNGSMMHLPLWSIFCPTEDAFAIASFPKSTSYASTPGTSSQIYMKRQCATQVIIPPAFGNAGELVIPPAMVNACEGGQVQFIDILGQVPCAGHPPMHAPLLSLMRGVLILRMDGMSRKVTAMARIKVIKEAT
uniref:Uncharacterized protein n=1 Tax=Leersia perrieri TaxID=77586 RepID=A0A0D9XSD5_9ORYZ